MSFVGRRAVAFGTTLDRELLPLKVPPNRFGNELGLRGAPNRGPGCYDNAEVVKKMPVSWLFVFFSSTAGKFLCEQALLRLRDFNRLCPRDTRCRILFSFHNYVLSNRAKVFS